MTEHEPHSIPTTEQLNDREAPGDADPTDVAERKVGVFLDDNAELFEVTNELWEDVEQAQNDLVQVASIPRRIVGDEKVGGKRLITLQTPKSTNPNDWPSGTRTYDSFKAITEHADIARQLVDGFSGSLRDIAALKVMFGREDVAFVLEMVDDEITRLRGLQPPPVAQFNGAKTAEHDAAFNAVGDNFIRAGVVQRLGMHKVEQLLEDTGAVLPFLSRIGAIAVASQEGDIQYPGLLETLAADAGQARTQQRASILQTALQRTLRERQSAGNTSGPASQASAASGHAPLEIWKNTRRLLKSFEHADRIFLPKTHTAD